MINRTHWQSYFEH